MPCFPVRGTGVAMPDAMETIISLQNSGYVAQFSRFVGSCTHSPVFSIACVAVTARWWLAAPNTRRWLSHNGVPTLPTFFASRPHPFDKSR